MKCPQYRNVSGNWRCGHPRIPTSFKHSLLILCLWLFEKANVFGVCLTELVVVQWRGTMTCTELLGSTSWSWLWVCRDQGMNVTILLNHAFYECFLHSVFHMKCESPPHQNKLFLFNNRLGIISLNEWISVWWQSHSWPRGRAKVTDGNRSLSKQMTSDASSLCADR